MHPLVVELAGAAGYTLRIRSDNGPQFIARMLAGACSKLQIEHEFIHPGTPQQNGHIEGFHSTVERLVCQQYELRYLPGAIEVLSRFYQTYNYRRIMSAIDYQTPYEVLCQWAATKGTSLPTPEQLTCMQTNFNPNQSQI
jgi:transposase InsO family protein